MTKAILPLFRQRASGTIVNISSIVGRVAYPLGSLYNASKFAVEGFSEALSYEVAAFGGRVRVVQPGLIQSEFASRSMVFSHDPSLSEYSELVSALGAKSQEFAESAEPAEIVAKAVWDAIHCETDQLRFPAGLAAEAALDERSALADVALMASIRQKFGI